MWIHSPYTSRRRVPITITKSSFFMPLFAIGKKNSVWYGAPSTYARPMAKSPVWRGHIQLSISPPYSPTERRRRVDETDVGELDLIGEDVLHAAVERRDAAASH
jgi:hypothetical protein